MAAPTATPSAPPSTSPAPASAGAQYPTPSSLPLEPTAFPPPPAYPTFVHNGIPYVYIPVPVAFLPGPQAHVTARKRKRPTTPPPCMLCRLSRTPCVANRPGEACQRCVLKQVDCFDDGDSAESSRLRHPPDGDGPDDADSEPERDPNQPPTLWQLPANGYSPQAPPYLSAAATPAKRERVIKACADCHARKRKCTGIGGPNCGVANPRAPPAPNGVTPGPNARPSPRKDTPGGASGHTRMREPCADCRGRKRRCVHHSDLGKDDAPGTDVDGPDESMRTDHESDVHPRSHSPHSPPRWPPHPPYYAAPPPPPLAFSGYPHNEHRMNYTAHPAGPGQLMHPHEHPYTHPPHPHGLHPSHAHPRLPPAPDMRHPIPGGPSCKECRARGVPCTCPETRADDGGANADGVPAPPAAPGAKGATPAPAPPAGRKGRACLACRKLKMRCVAPNGDNGNANPDGPDERCQRCERAGLECIYVDRKRRGPGAVFGVQTDGSQPTTGSFEGFNQNGQNASQNPGANASQNQAPTNPNQNGAPNGINGTTNGPDGLVRPNTPSQRPPAKKLKREGSPRTSSPYPNAGGVRRIAPGPGEDALMHLVTVDDIRMQRVMGEDAARTLEESFADDDEDEDSSSR